MCTVSVRSFELFWNANGPDTYYDAVRGDVATLRAAGGDFALAAQACVATRIPQLSVGIDESSARRSRRLVPRAERQLRRGVELRRPGRAAGRTAGSRDRGLGRRLSVKARCAPRLTRA